MKLKNSNAITILLFMYIYINNNTPVVFHVEYNRVALHVVLTHKKVYIINTVIEFLSEVV